MNPKQIPVGAWKKLCVVEMAKNIRYAFIWLMMSVLNASILICAIKDKSLGACIFVGFCLVCTLGALYAAIYDLKRWRERYED